MVRVSPRRPSCLYTVIHAFCLSLLGAFRFCLLPITSSSLHLLSLLLLGNPCRGSFADLSLKVNTLVPGLFASELTTSDGKGKYFDVMKLSIDEDIPARYVALIDYIQPSLVKPCFPVSLFPLPPVLPLLSLHALP